MVVNARKTLRVFVFKTNHYSFAKNPTNIQSRLLVTKTVELTFQWIPGHSHLSCNEVANFLAKVGASLPASGAPCSFSPLSVQLRLFLYTLWRYQVPHLT